MTANLDVLLDTSLVGTLELGNSGERTFRFRPEYESSMDRRVLGQWFEDEDRTQSFVGRQALPHFFGKLLPQGELKKYLIRELGLQGGQDFHLLAALGGDLPGAIRVVPPVDMPVERARREVAGRAKSRPVVSVEHYFSLAGMQLKFSMVEASGKLTLPSKTGEGRFIVKLPDVKMPGVPETEMAMLTWAREVGIKTVDARLEPVENLRLAFEDLPSMTGRTALAVARYDRTERGRRHQEDFAQVLGISPDDKYAQKERSRRARAHTIEGILTVLHAISPEDLDDALLRVVFSVLSGNEDAHLKNWSLLYEQDGRTARLSPAYDLVCTVAFVQNTTARNALTIGGESAMERVTDRSFRELAVLFDESEAALARRVRAHAERVRDTQGVLLSTSLPPMVRSHLDKHLASMPLGRRSG